MPDLTSHLPLSDCFLINGHAIRWELPERIKKVLPHFNNRCSLSIWVLSRYRQLYFESLSPGGRSVR